MKKCPSCNREFPDERKFCPFDGTRLAEPSDSPSSGETISVKKCPTCAREFPAERKFCPFDGTRLGEVTAAQKKQQKTQAKETPRLSIRFPEGDVREVALGEAPQRIGSGSENSIQLTDPYVSRRHATLLYKEGQYVVIDAGSSNGVFVNGQRIAAEGWQLRPGDQIVIGKTRLTFSAPATGPSAATVVDAEPPVPPVSQPARPPVSEPHKPVPVELLKPFPAEPSTSVLDGRYEIESRIGQSSAGEMYRARRVLLGDQVMVKTLRPEMVRDPAAVERFRREAKVAARIRHPNSVQVIDFGSTPEGGLYLVEELLSGNTLRDLLNRERALTLRRIVGLFNQICGAVHTAHLNGIVLRDIKPESVFIEQTPDGKELVKVGGYGLAQVDSSMSAGITLADQAKFFGAPQYRSPEQWLGKPLDSRSDVYSLGVILFEMLTGVVPFDSPSMPTLAQMHLNALVPDLTRLGRPDIDEGIASVINRALEKDPARRQPTALHMAAEVAAVSEAGGGLVEALLQKVSRSPGGTSALVIGQKQPAPAGEVALPSVVVEAEAKGRGAFNGIVLALMLEAFLSRLAGGLVKIALPLYSQLVFGLDLTATIALVVVQDAVPLLLRPVFGSLADRYGKKPIFLFSLLIRAIATVLLALANLPALLYAISFIRGVGDSAKGPSASAMIADATDERYIARAFSWYTTTKSTSGGIGETVAAILITTFVVFLIGSPVVAGQSVYTIPLEEYRSVIDPVILKKAFVAVFIISAALSALSLILVAIFIKEKKKARKKKSEYDAGRMTAMRQTPQARQPGVWSFAFLGMALTAPAYMVSGDFFTLLATDLGINARDFAVVKGFADIGIPLLFGPLFGWLADRIGTGKVIAVRSLANLVSSAIFLTVPNFIGTALFGVLVGAARSMDEIGKAAFKPTWGAIAAKVSSFNPDNRSRTLGILDAGVDAATLSFPLVSAALYKLIALTGAMAVRSALAILAEIYALILMRKYKI